MPNKLISDCPVCGEKLKAIKLSCSTCGTIIENEFTLSKFEQLTNEQLQFIEIFLKSGGSIKEVEKELGISYPTVKGKLNTIIKALGYNVEDDKPLQAKTVIDQLESGEITAEEAIKKIKLK